MKVFQQNGRLTPTAQFCAGLFLLVVLVIGDAKVLLSRSVGSWYSWIEGILWIFIAGFYTALGWQRMRTEKQN